MKTFKFLVVNHGEITAGIRPFTEKVEIKVETDPGGDSSEFTEFMRDSLAEWFDGSYVLTEEEAEEEARKERDFIENCLD